MSTPDELKRRWQVVLTYHSGSPKLWRQYLLWQRAQYATFAVHQISQSYQSAVQVLIMWHDFDQILAMEVLRLHHGTLASHCQLDPFALLSEQLCQAQHSAAPTKQSPEQASMLFLPDLHTQRHGIRQISLQMLPTCFASQASSAPAMATFSCCHAVGHSPPRPTAALTGSEYTCIEQVIVVKW